jgi:transposase, IS6 family
MKPQNLFKWKHYEGEMILLTVRWYLSYSLSFRNIAEMMEERGLCMVHTTIMRWVHQYGPELEKRIRRHLKQTNGSWKVDETYIKVKGKWKYLYRAVDSNGNTIDFLLCARRNRKAAKRFFRKALRSSHTKSPRTISLDKNAAYPPAIRELQKEKKLPNNVDIRRIKYLNNMVEQDHRFIKKLVRPMLGFQSFRTASRTLKGIEAMHMIRKGQISSLGTSASEKVNFIQNLFKLAV